MPDQFDQNDISIIKINLQKNFYKLMENKYQSPSSSYKLAQVLGTNYSSSEVEDQDLISCLRYDPTGKFLCLGDKAGRIIIFQDTSPSKSVQKQFQLYDYYAEFQSHIRQFDPLKGNQSSEQIIDISWLRPQGKYIKLLTTNSKSIKVWKASQKTDKRILKSANKELNMPKLQSQDPAFSANQLFIFPSVHSCRINSLTHSKNQQYVLSTDEEKSFFWCLQKPNRPYIVHSIAQKRKKGINQISITCSKMHPDSDSIFAYGMNRCEIGLCDMRISCNIASVGKVLDFGVETGLMKNFLTDMVATVGSIQFSKNGKYLISRQYLNVKVWDISQTKKPLLNICIQEGLKSKLASLFESQNIFDKFSIASCCDNSTILTGNYNNYFHLLNLQNGMNTQYELSFDKENLKREIIAGKNNHFPKLDTKKKTSALAFHPKKQEIVVASLNSFFVYHI